MKVGSLERSGHEDRKYSSLNFGKENMRCGLSITDVNLGRRRRVADCRVEPPGGRTEGVAGGGDITASSSM